MKNSVWKPLFLGLGLLIFGFLSGYGFQARKPSPPPLAVTPTPTPQAPLVKGLHASPDGKFLAFTGVFDESSRAATFLLSLQTGQFASREAPVGWQDYVTQWSRDGQSLLLEREKIPRPVAEAKAGLYRAPLQNGKFAGVVQSLTQGLAPPGEKIITGFWAPNGNLVLKTRREPKALYLVENETPRPLDRAGVTYHQNRAVLEGQKLVFYVVRDIVGAENQVALFRIESGRARQISTPLTDISWAYVSENGRQMIAARQAANGTDWSWSLYAVSPQNAKLVKTATIPGDVITVYWSPDGNQILGAAGAKLWLIAIPTLKVSQLGSQGDWNADDAAWIGRQKAIVVAADGELWRVDMKTGKKTAIWKFPAKFWE